MTKQTVKYLALSLAVLGVTLISSPSPAQAGLASKLPGKRASSSTAQAASRQTQTPGAASYTYTLLSYPGQLSTAAICINKGATTSKTEIVGGYGDNGNFSQAGFLVELSGKKNNAESYQAVNDPHKPAQQEATCINDAGQIVGTYLDSSNFNHGYERIGGKFTPLEVPFAGATATLPFSINDSGEVVGCWGDSDGNDHGFTLIGGTYASFDYPGGSQTCADDINSAGDIIGTYFDASGVENGFLLSGGTYTSFAYPGAVQTFVNGINDSGVIVGGYCTTTECEDTLDGVQNFLLSGGVFTPINILPGEVYAVVDDINNDGVLVGWYQDADGLVVSFMATP
jgi:hypothetical protein